MMMVGILAFSFLSNIKESSLSMKATGNLVGLKPNHLQRLNRLYDRKVDPNELISQSLAQSICEISRELNRQIGITIDRRGKVVHVIVGDSHQLFIPDLGRERGGKDRFRGIRLVHTHLKNETLSNDDLTDLSRLRLDLIAAIGVTEDGKPANLYYTHLLPVDFSHAEQSYADITTTNLNDISLDLNDFIEDLEGQFNKTTAGFVETKGQIRAIAVHVSTDSHIDPKASLRELSELARTANIIIVEGLIQKRPQIDPKFVMGKGKLDELLLSSMQLDCEIVIFDQDLTPGQIRSIAEVTDLKVIDRTQLILDIFAQRAHTHEGKLAVELAQHKYLLPRLAHNNTAFSRLEGGVGGRGPGETKLEIDRRRARDRIIFLEDAIRKTEKQRESQRAKRQTKQIPHIVIMGYTNAGKSTLFNALTQSEVLAEDKLFATLHVTTRKLHFDMNKDALFSDTVGFIRDLPPDLMPAFKATLEELHEADLLLHVVDIGDSRKDQQIGSVLKVLEEMKLLDRPRILVFNKIDLLEPEIAQNICNLYQAFGVQALDLKTLKPLLSFIEQRLTELNAFQKYNRKYIDFSEYEHLYQKYQNQEDPDQE